MAGQGVKPLPPWPTPEGEKGVMCLDHTEPNQGGQRLHRGSSGADVRGDGRRSNRLGDVTSMGCARGGRKGGVAAEGKFAFLASRGATPLPPVSYGGWAWITALRTRFRSLPQHLCSF
jgi:hypothetical protein